LKDRLDLKQLAVGECRCMQCGSLMDQRLVVVRAQRLSDGSNGREVCGYCVHCRLSHRRFQVPSFGGPWLEAGLCVESDDRPADLIVAEYRTGEVRAIASVARRYRQPRYVEIDLDSQITPASELYPA
jgi:hypothetical protein